MKRSKILVIGGAGYVGSHFSWYAANEGFHVTVMDNLSTGHSAATKMHDFVDMDLLYEKPVRRHFSENRYDAVFHFAASCLVGESVAEPAKYYENNIIAAYNMLEALRESSHDRVVFSSSCAVYGLPEHLPLQEEHPKNPISPYGRTKLAIEWMLEDYHRAYGLRSASLRYFNAAGCEPQAGLGEDHNPETHIIPNVVRYALQLTDELVIFGNDYPTPDGTCIRDYIHVTDLAEAHLKALDKLEEVELIRLNLGTGTGYSNLQVVETVGRIAGKDLNPAFGPRRPGDPPELVADASEAANLLPWVASRSGLEKICSEVLQWFSEHPNGYSSLI